MDDFDPRPEDRFSFGLWTVGNVGRDPFGEPVRERLAPERIVAKLAECGAWGVNLHDEDLVPRDASAATPRSSRSQVSVSPSGWSAGVPSVATVRWAPTTRAARTSPVQRVEMVHRGGDMTVWFIGIPFLGDHPCPRVVAGLCAAR